MSPGGCYLLNTGLLLLATCQLNTVQAQTNGGKDFDGGILRGSNILTKADGPVIKVISSLEIPIGASLTITKGVTLLLPKFSKILINGNLRVDGTEEEPVLFKCESEADRWEGVHISGYHANRATFSHLALHNTNVGVRITQQASLKANHVTVISPHDAGMIFEDSNDVKLFDVSITPVPPESCGLCVILGSNFLVDGCDLDRGKGYTVGIKARDVNGITIKHCKVSSGTMSGMDLIDVYGNVSLISSSFKANTGGSVIRTASTQAAFVTVDKVRFTSIGFSGHCLKIECQGRQRGVVTVRDSVVYGCLRAIGIAVDNQNVTVVNNQMYLNKEALTVELNERYCNATIKDNTFYYNSGSTAAFQFDVHATYFSGYVEIASNLFQQNQCPSSLRLHLESRDTSGMLLKVLGNRFAANSFERSPTGDQATVVLNFFDLSGKLLFENNSFSNPGMPYDLAATSGSYSRGFVIDASKNFWDFTRKTKTEVEERILGHHSDPGRAEILIEPFILSAEPYIISSMCNNDICECPSGYGGSFCQEPSCEDRANCSQHGNCVGPHQCECTGGWAGDNCSHPICERGCSGHGICTAPNECHCSPGWQGQTCSLYACSGNCSDHGECVGPEVCRCFSGWSGDQCVESICSNVNNCTSGKCVDANTCECESGWVGTHCEQPSCEVLHNCSGHGECVGPKECLCEDGWSSASCDVPLCLGANNCSGRGTCVQPNICACEETRKGEDCEGCSDGHWGRDCLPCPECVHGVCQPSGTCTCENSNWSGSLCERCSETFHGPDCLPLPTVLQLLPNSGPETGGTMVKVKGDNYQEANKYICRFGVIEVQGNRTSADEVQCVSPPCPLDFVEVNIKPQQGGFNFTDSQVIFTYYRKCPDGACGQDDDLPRGTCVFGACVCHSPWSGESCSTLKLAPDISKILAQTALEFQDFHLQTVLVQGEVPMSWTLKSGPTDMRIHPETGQITWERARASLEEYRVTIMASNDIGADEESFSLTVEPGYTATLLKVDPPGPFLVPQVPVLLIGEVNQRSILPKLAPLPIEIKIKCGDVMKTIQATSEPGRTSFSEMFYPTRNDIGYFEAVARHPASDELAVQVNWTVLGMAVTPRSLRLSGNEGEILTASFSIRNAGPTALTNIKYLIVGYNQSSNQISLKLDKRDRVLEGEVLFTEIYPMEELLLNVSIDAQKSLTGSFTLVFNCAEQTNVTLKIDLIIANKHPILQLTPVEINNTVFRGKERTHRVLIENVGLATAYDLQLEPSTTDVLFILAFDKIDAIDLDYSFVDLQSGESAMMTVVLAPPIDSYLGERREHIVVRSREAQSTLHINVYVTSETKLNLTISVEDERTCFAAGNPRLAGAKVVLLNTIRGVKMEMTSDNTGMVTFENVNEDHYELSVRATNHKPMTKVILVSPGEEKLKVFLQKTVVNISWTTVLNPDEGNAEVDLETDIEEGAHLPVITINPATLSLDGLESGDDDVINLRLVNHGLVPASDLTMRLPENHPFLKFEMDDIELGVLLSNSSMMTFVRVSKKIPMVHRTQVATQDRASSMPPVDHLLIGLTYNYTCGETVQRKVDVILTRGPPRPTKNCTSCPSGPAVERDVTADEKIPNLEYNIPVIQSVFCEECLQSVMKCAEKIPIDNAWRDCSKAIFAQISGNTNRSGSGIVGAVSILDLFLICGEMSGKTARLPVPETVDEKKLDGKDQERERSGLQEKSNVCISELSRACSDKVSVELSENKLLKQEDIAPKVARRKLFIQLLYDMREVIFDDKAWHAVRDPTWYKVAVKPALSINSDGGVLVTATEYTRILENYGPPYGVTAEATLSFLRRMNSTLSLWQKGELDTHQDSIKYADFTKLYEPFLTGIKQMVKDGYSDPLTWYDEGVRLFHRTQKRQGNCARAKIIIEQRSVEAMDQFPVTMEIQNKNTMTLVGLQTELVIRRVNDGSDAIAKFNTGVPDTDGIEIEEGLWILPQDTTAHMKWLITPGEYAASEGEVTYELGCNIRHTFKGQSISVYIRGDIVTIFPMPKLQVHYFHPLRVYGDDPLTEDQESPIPFTIGMLVSNVGYGTVRDFRLKSCRPFIVNKVTGRAMQYKITEAMLGSEEILPTLQVEFGDIGPQETRSMRWRLSCKHDGIFTNFSALFENANILGDPTLSRLEEIAFHELLYEVRVDLPEDDNLLDYIVSESSSPSLPATVYRSDDCSNTIPIVTDDEVVLHVVLSSAEITELQILVVGVLGGWHFVRIPFECPTGQQLKQIRRHDGREILLDHNLKLSGKSDDVSAILLFDWFEEPSWRKRRRKRDVSTFNSYSIRLGLPNKPPQFPKRSYQSHVTENRFIGEAVMACPATDVDNRVTYYQLDGYSADDGIPPFGITDSGDVVVTGTIDREYQSVYRLRVTAYDNGEPPQSAKADVGITIQDLNDNLPIFEKSSYSIRLESNAEPGVCALVVRAIDRDEGVHAQVFYTLNSKGEVPFMVNQDTGAINVSGSIVQQSYVLEIKAHNGHPSLSSVTNVVINIVQAEEEPIVFSDTLVNVEVLEEQPTGLVVANILPRHVDVTSEITYEILSRVPFTIDNRTGDILTTTKLDRETRDKYNMTVRAVDQGAVPSGKTSSEVTVLINVSDLNDNAPEFNFPEVKVYVKEDAEVNTVIHVISAVDKDWGQNGEISTYELNSTPDVSQVKFFLNHTDSGVQLCLGANLDREKESGYLLKLIALDGGQPSLTGTASLFIIVEDVNDNPPTFPDTTDTAVISKSLPLNAEVYTAKAIDNDIKSSIVYSVSNISETFRVNPNSGVVRLVKSLRNVTNASYDVIISAYDGTYTTSMTLNLKLSTENLHPPVFESSEYRVEIPEFFGSGSYVAIVFASDRDGDWVTYSVDSGDADNLYDIDTVSGEIITRYPVDAEKMTNYTLIIGARDGKANDPRTRTGSTTVRITITNINEYPPKFRQGRMIRVHITENNPINTVIPIEVAIDDDGDTITYELVDDSEIFHLEPDRPDLYVSRILDRELDAKFHVRILAFDNGSPPKGVDLDVEVVVLDVNDNAPVVLSIDQAVKVVQGTVRMDIPIYKVKSIDPDIGANAELTYALVNPVATFVIDNRTGSVFCTKKCLETTENSTSLVEINVCDYGLPKRCTAVTVSMTILVLPVPKDEGPSGEHTATMTTALPPVSTTDSIPVTSNPSVPSTTPPLESTTTATTTTRRPLPTAAFPLWKYMEICKMPIDAVVNDKTGIFFFQGNNIWRIFEESRHVVRGYPKTIKRIYSGWLRRKISGPILAAIHSYNTGLTYLIKENELWLFSNRRLQDISEFEGPTDLQSPDCALTMPDRSMYVFKGNMAYKLIEYDAGLTIGDSTPIQSLMPGAPTPIQGAFTATDRSKVYLFSKQLVYEWKVSIQGITEDSPVHITAWLGCIDY